MKEYFEYAAPVLLVTFLLTWLVRRAGVFHPANKRVFWIIVPAVSLISLIPMNGLSVADYILSFSPNFSIGSIALFGILTWRELTGKHFLRTRDILMFSLWNLLISLPLYASTFGFLSWDLYALGYRFSILFVVTASVTLLLVILKHPISFIFVAYIVAFHLQLLPSNNFFDYITDGVLFAISLFFLLSASVRSLYKKLKTQRVIGETT